MGMFSMFCGTVLEVLTALEVRRKVCVAPLGLRALQINVLASGVDQMWSVRRKLCRSHKREKDDGFDVEQVV